MWGFDQCMKYWWIVQSALVIYFFRWLEKDFHQWAITRSSLWEKVANFFGRMLFGVQKVRKHIVSYLIWRRSTLHWYGEWFVSFRIGVLAYCWCANTKVRNNGDQILHVFVLVCWSPDQLANASTRDSRNQTPYDEYFIVHFYINMNTFIIIIKFMITNL